MIDCDVHPLVPGGAASLIATPERARTPSTLGSTARPAFRANNPSPGIVAGALRPDAVPPGGGLPGEDPGFVAEQLLDRHGVERAILIPLVHDVWSAGDAAPAIAAAVNRHIVETWLALDPRFALSLCVAPGDPARGAAEIRELAGVPGVVGVFVPLEDRLIGDGWYEPILAAAERAGLTVVLHPTGAEGTYPRAAHLPGGPVASYVERHVAVTTVAAANVASLVLDGTLAAHPHLRFAVIEFGFTWVGPLLARLDAQWALTGRAGRRPSATVVDRVFFGTQPIEEPHPRELARMVEAMGGERSLLFASDYPHWDTDDVDRALTALPAATRAAVMERNARRAFPRLVRDA